jgi:ribosomal protein S18 acetylase RimI-like enzyme
MTDTHDFHFDDADYFVCELQSENTQLLQKLFEQCADYAMIVEGESVSPSAAQETFETVPTGRSLSDKFVYGVLDRNGNIVGVLEGMCHYPDEMTWWIGLFMLAPEVRGHGLGQRLIKSFSDYVRSEQGASIMLGVVEENRAAYHFWQKLGFELVRKTEPRLFGRKTQAVYVMRRNVL